MPSRKSTPALESEQAQGADPEDQDEYRAENIFWVPPEARWAHLKAQARQLTIGQLVDHAMDGIERDNRALKDVLPKNYARPALDWERLGRLIDMISNIRVGDEDARSKDMLGRVYEYFLPQFASAEGKKGCEFYTPHCVVKLLGRDAGTLSGPGVRSLLRVVRHVRAIGGVHPRARHGQWKRLPRTPIRGREGAPGTSPSTARSRIIRRGRLAKMNLAIRGIEGQIAHGGSFHDDRHPDLKADFMLANPPFNVSDWGATGSPTPSAGNTAPCPRATPTSAGCSTWSITWHPGRGRLRARQRIDVVEPVGRGRNQKKPDRDRLRGLHGGATGQLFYLDPNPRLPVVPCPHRGHG